MKNFMESTVIALFCFSLMFICVLRCGNSFVSAVGREWVCVCVCLFVWNLLLLAAFALIIQVCECRDLFYQCFPCSNVTTPCVDNLIKQAFSHKTEYILH